MTGRELARTIILDILNTTGITATAGIGSNLYLCKIAMDIEAKHIPPDEHGVRIAELDELHYRRALWGHRPLTDFWRVGRGYARKLEAHGLYTMGDVARCSMENEELLYKLFGINAELLIDHAWGWEPCTIADIKAYRPASSGCSSGQVLHCPYPGRWLTRWGLIYWSADWSRIRWCWLWATTWKALMIQSFALPITGNLQQISMAALFPSPPWAPPICRALPPPPGS